MLVSIGTLICPNCSNRFSAYGSGFSLTAPVLTWTSGVNVATAVFEIVIPEDVPSGYKVEGEASLTSGGVAFDTETAVIAAGDLTDLQIDDFAFDPFTSGTKYVRVRLLTDADVPASGWSNIETKTLDVDAPTITSANSANNAENSVLAHALTANEAVTWTITGGADAAEFEISGSTLRWASNGTQDYETPGDDGTNNTYVVQVTATDAATNATNQTVTITVTDVSDTSYTAVAADFNGTNTYLTRGANLTGLSNGKAGLLSVWLRFDGGNGATQRLFRGSSAGAHWSFSRFSSNKFSLIALNGSATNILAMTSTTSWTTNAAWRHLLASWDLAAGLGHLYVSDVDDLAGSPTLTNDTIIYGSATEVYIGAEAGPQAYFNGCMSEFFFNPTYLDITVEANRRKFIDAGGKPVSLGADGSTPLSTQPLVYLANELTTWQTNLGTGGGFTENGTLGTASSSPSD